MVNSVAGFEKYGGPCIVVDFGTATTFDVVSVRGEYLGGVIAPGIGISAEALFSRTANVTKLERNVPSFAPVRFVSVCAIARRPMPSWR